MCGKHNTRNITGKLIFINETKSMNGQLRHVTTLRLRGRGCRYVKWWDEINLDISLDTWSNSYLEPSKYLVYSVKYFHLIR